MNNSFDKWVRRDKDSIMDMTRYFMGSIPDIYREKDWRFNISSYFVHCLLDAFPRKFEDCGSAIGHDVLFLQGNVTVSIKTQMIIFGRPYKGNRDGMTDAKILMMKNHLGSSKETKRTDYDRLFAVQYGEVKHLRTGCDFGFAVADWETCEKYTIPEKVKNTKEPTANEQTRIRIPNGEWLFFSGTQNAIVPKPMNEHTTNIVIRDRNATYDKLTKIGKKVKYLNMDEIYV